MKINDIITNLIGHNLTIIVIQNLFLIGSYEINTNVIHLFVLFEHQCCAHCLNMNVIYLFILFKYKVVCLFVLFKHENFAHDFCV